MTDNSVELDESWLKVRENEGMFSFRAVDRGGRRIKQDNVVNGFVVL